MVMVVPIDGKGYKTQDIDQNLNRIFHRAANVGSAGTTKSSTNIVIIMAITASVNASSLVFDTGLPPFPRL